MLADAENPCGTLTKGKLVLGVRGVDVQTKCSSFVFYPTPKCLIKERPVLVKFYNRDML